jgi:predicted RNase H-like HicB family nuclease
MNISWQKTKDSYEYYYGKTETRFSAQIGVSTEPGKCCWMIFHSDFKYCVFGDSTNNVEEAKEEIQKWLNAHSNIETDK